MPMARQQRGFGSKSTQDLSTEAESLQKTLTQLQAMNVSKGRGGNRGRGGNANQRPRDRSLQRSQTWQERPRNPERSWGQGGMNNYRQPGERYPRNNYPPPQPALQEFQHNMNPRNYDYHYQSNPSEREAPHHHHWYPRNRYPPHHSNQEPPPPPPSHYRYNSDYYHPPQYSDRRPPPYRNPRGHYPPRPSDYGRENDLGPPPPYRPPEEEVNQDARSQQTIQGPREPLTINELIIMLKRSPDFSISLLTLVEERGVQSKDVRMIVELNNRMLRIENENVVFAPRLKMCLGHSNSNGCQNFRKCDSLHICPEFVLDNCSEGETCLLGHKWRTDHNLSILKRLSLENVENRVLRGLLKKDNAKNQSEMQDKTGPLDVCEAYNNGGCDQLECPKLHVCLSFVLGLTKCTIDECSLNHNLLSPASCHLLKLYNISVNETPRDVAMALLEANPAIKDKGRLSTKSPPGKVTTPGQKNNKNKDIKNFDQQSVSRKKKVSEKKEKVKTSSDSETENESDNSYDKGKKNRRLKASRALKAKKEGSQSESSTSETEAEDNKLPKSKKKKGKASAKDDTTTSTSETESDDTDDDRTAKTKKQHKPKKSSVKLQQKSRIPQDTTKQELSKAPPQGTLWAHYLYGDVAVPEICYYSVEEQCRDEVSGCSKLHSIFHYHWQVREQSGRWMNLRPKQVTCIEKAFCDPANNDVNLPVLDPFKLDVSLTGLFRLLGRDVWQANLSNNTLVNSTKTKNLDLRRLCTKSEGGQVIKESTYHWYFLDINMKWVEYGNADTNNRKEYVSSITSADIETHYLKTPNMPLSFKNSKFTFVLDLVSMKQTNLSTGTSRPVQRRPEPHLPENDDKGKPASSNLPPHWKAMQPEQHSLLVTLNSGSEEYNNVATLLTSGISAANIIKINRIQNPFMWNSLENKIKEMTSLYKDASLVNVKQLFHGTNSNVVNNICKENFDWRLHGTSAGQAYGQGTYFATQSGTSRGYCKPDANGQNYMFVAKVAVGSMIQGNHSMTRPPINPSTQMPYDSTVDNTSNPAIIVKYDKQEYYPEYLIVFK